MATSLEGLVYDNRFVASLPADPEVENFRRQVYGACFSRVAPTPVAAPRILSFSREMAEELGLDPDSLSAPSPTGESSARILAGNALAPGMDSFASCYGGHQFGHWAGQLGDGRAISLGEALVSSADEDSRRWELQLKGAGPTPYSRGADGRAVIRSSVREFLCSEAMFHLGVPTTRALSLVWTGDDVVRDMFYDGRAAPEPGAVVCRVAPSFLRFGHFELLASRREIELLKTLADYTIDGFFPQLARPGRRTGESYVELLAEICRRTAIMVDHWQRVGFVHGVMNTDNMSVLGLTIDYGPYGWLEGFDPDWTPNTTDAEGRRYRFGFQPRIAHWNLARFAESLYPLVGEVEPLEEALEEYSKTYNEAARATATAKLGMDRASESVDALAADLSNVLTLTETDMTLFYRSLADIRAAGKAAPSPEELLKTVWEAFYRPEEVEGDVEAGLLDWLQRYVAMCRDQGLQDTERRIRMNRVNPKFVLRNYLAQLAIDKAEQGDGSLVDETLEVMRRPYDEQPGREAYGAKRPEWARHRPGCSMLSCSS